MKITALILARGGSKGILHKNCKLLNGIPLIGRTLLAAKDWKNFDSIWVSTDCKEIAKISETYGANVHFRSPHVAKDATPSIDAILEFLAHHDGIEHLALLQCTSPCLQPQFLESAFILISSNAYDSIFAVCREYPLRWKPVCEGNITEPLNFDRKHRPRRQDWNGELVECGMFYFTTVDALKKGCLQGGRCGYVEIPKEYSIEIDTEFDWLLAEVVVREYGYNPK